MLRLNELISFQQKRVEDLEKEYSSGLDTLRKEFDKER